MWCPARPGIAGRSCARSLLIFALGSTGGYNTKRGLGTNCPGVPSCFENVFRTVIRREVVTVDELVKLVAKKTGVSEDVARIAVQTVVGYLKDKLPAPIAGQIDNVLQSGGTAGGAADIAKDLGGLFGKK